MHHRHISRCGLARRAFAALLLAHPIAAQGTMQTAGFDLETLTHVPIGLDSVTRSRGGPLGDDLILAGATSVGFRTIWRTPPSGGEPQELMTGQDPFLYLEAVPGGSLYSVSSLFGDLRELTMQNGQLTVARSIAGIDGSEGLLYVDSGPNQGKLFVSNYVTNPMAVYTLDVANGGSALSLFQTISLGATTPLALATMPGSAFGDSLYTVNYNRQVIRFDAASESVLATLPSLTESIAAPPPGSAFGEYLYSLATDGVLYRIDAQGNVQTFADGFAVSVLSTTLDFSPDGRHLYLATDEEPWIIRITPNAFARCAYRNGTGTNDDACRCANVPAIGANWSLTVEPTPDTLLTFVFASDAAAPLPLPAPFGEVLIGAPLLDIPGNGTHTAFLPPALNGFELYLQGMRLDFVASEFELQLVNSLRAVIGL